MYARESFTIAEVADLLSIRRLSDSYQDEFPVECPFCGDLRGKCSFCICKNGELKNVDTVCGTIRHLWKEPV